METRPTKASAKVYLTKLAAAQRQLRAAIRMYFAGEDELAIHTVAYAAYRIIADLKSNRGRDEAADHHLMQIFYAVRSYHRGDLPTSLAANSVVLGQIRELARQLPITAASRWEDVKDAILSKEAATEYWRKQGKAANYLKHADRDSQRLLLADEIDNLSLLAQASASYSDLTQDGLKPEGLVLWVYSCVSLGNENTMPERHRRLATELKSLSPSQRLEFCSEWLRRLVQKDAASVSSPG